MKPEVHWKKPVPFIVNGRVHSYITDPEDGQIMLRVAMRRYHSQSGIHPAGWQPEYVDLCFSRKKRNFTIVLFSPMNGSIEVSEIYYEVENPHIRWDDADKLSAIPVITA